MPIEHETPARETFDPADRAEAILNHLIATKGGSRRDGQVEMARHVATSLNAHEPQLVEGGTGIGKALDVDTPIPTPNGFVRMGDLKLGDEVFDENGQVCQVTKPFDVRKNRRCYEIEFSGGGTLIADADHPFMTITNATLHRRTGDDPWEGAQIRTTEEIEQTLRVRGGRNNHRVPLAGALEIRDRDLPIDPYELGIWLGGTERRSATRALVTPAVVPETMEHFTVTPYSREVAIEPTPETKDVLEELGLLDVERPIPQMYLLASESQRWDLLTGLMDAMGQARVPERSKVAQVAAYKTQERLVEDTAVLVSTLGMRASVSTREFGQGSFRQVTFTPTRLVFRAPNKIARSGDFSADAETRRRDYRSITRVTRVTSRPVRCIEVNSSSHLYLAGYDCIPTHNSMAYLAGALASGQRTAVAPHTKALQDQLGQDLDVVVEAFAGCDFEADDAVLDHAPSYAIIKGRSAYYCGNKVLAVANEPAQDTLDDGAGSDYSPTSSLGQEMATLMEWAKTTTTGDRVDAPPVSHEAWQAVCGSTDDCSANECKEPQNAERCFAQRAHERAREADIVVVNQSYLAAAMKIEFLGLAGCDAVVVDEAHEFANVVADAFGAVLKRARMEHVLRRGVNLVLTDDLIDESAAEGWNRELTHYLDELERILDQRMSKYGADRDVVSDSGVQGTLKELVRLFGSVAEKLRAAMNRYGKEEKGRSVRRVALQAVENLVADIQILREGSNDVQVCWADRDNRVPVLHSARFDVADTIHEHLIERIAEGSVVMTSATLTVGGSFDHPAQQMGFTVDPDTYPWQARQVSSPFDYQKQGMIWLPEDMPAPVNTPEGKAEYAEAVAENAIGVARAAGGRTLVLCTSKQSVETVSARMAEVLEPEGITVLVQRPGEPSRILADEFASNPRSVLVGTRTFWTGVSINGDACVAVVVDKLPFPTPADPIIAARTEKVDRLEGRGKGFSKVSLAEAILTIVQGVGRLIRTVDDRGVVVLCDPRVNPRTRHSKSYWRAIAKSLPPFTRTTEPEAVFEFLREIDRTANDTADHAEVEEPAEGVGEAQATV